MLNSINLNDKSYEDLLAEALSQIPLYSDEWTNFNVSDPGITILQNFTAFNLLQQSYINEVTEEIRRRLLKLVGIEAGENQGARVLLKAISGDGESIHLPEHRKLKAGDLCFETTRPITISPSELQAVYTETEGRFKDITYLLDRDVPASAAIFGAMPKEGMALYCVMNVLPEAGEMLIIHVGVDDTHSRNPFEKGRTLPFASVQWEYYTETGFQPIPVEDETNCFLVSGALRFQIPETLPAIFEETPETGYVLRCVLKEAAYDLPPRIRSFTANLFEVVQHDTKAVSFLFEGGKAVELHSDMIRYDNIFVFCREKRGSPFRIYKEYTGWQAEGRYFIKTPTEDGGIRIEFDRLKFGFAPLRSKEAVCIICYEEEMVHHRLLGTVYGYEDQIIDIDLVQHLDPEQFTLLVETKDETGEVGYQLVKPEETDPDALCYSVVSESGQICVHHPGVGEECRVFLCDCVVTSGSEGNIREGNQFEPVFHVPERPDERYFNPAAGKGGYSRETTEQLRLRLIDEMNRPTAAVLASDYETIVKQTPGLCIHKVKAVADEENHLVKVVVKPYTENRFSKMSPVYLREIYRHLDSKRMITTRVELVQPKYIPIDVQGAVYIKSYYENSQQEIEALLREELDYIDSEREFGALIRFNDLYHKLESLPCVDYIYELILNPQARGEVQFVGADIQLGDNCLCYLGRLSLELNTRMGVT